MKIVFFCRKFPANISQLQFLSYINQTGGFIDQIQYNTNDLKILDDIFAFNKLTPTQVMSALIQPCDELLARCRWRDEIIPCNTIIETTFSEYGICCTFNKNNKIK